MMEKKYSKYSIINYSINHYAPGLYNKEDYEPAIETLEAFMDKYDPEEKIICTSTLVNTTYTCLFNLFSKHYKPKPETTIDKVYDYFKMCEETKDRVNNFAWVNCLLNAMKLFGEKIED